MGSEGPKNITCHVTGFKKFQGVSENPTETIVSNLNEYVSKNGLPTGVKLASCTILETAGEGAKPALFELFERAAPNPDNESVVWVSLHLHSCMDSRIDCLNFLRSYMPILGIYRTIIFATAMNLRNTSKYLFFIGIS